MTNIEPGQRWKANFSDEVWTIVRKTVNTEIWIARNEDQVQEGLPTAYLLADHQLIH